MTRHGFTILEVTLVLAIMVLLAAISYPSIEGMYSDVRLTAAADQIRARWADARTQSIEEGRAYRFAVRDDGRYRIAPDSSEFWTDAATADGVIPNDTDSPPLDLEESLPKGVKFSDGGINAGEPGDGAGWVTVVRFLPDGTASQDVEIVFEASGARPLQLKLRGLTGAVTAVKLDPGEGAMIVHKRSSPPVAMGGSRFGVKNPPVATGGLAGVSRKGLSLLEVLISLAIFLFSLVALGQLIGLGSDLAIETQWLGRAAMLAQSRMSEVTAGSLPLSSQSETPCDEDPDFTWAIDSEADAAQGLYRVTVTISRPRTDGSRFQIALAELVLDPLIRGNTDGTPTGTDSTTTTPTTGGTSP